MNAPLAAETAMLAMSAMQRSSPAWDATIAAMQVRAAETMRRVVESETAQMVSQPWRITRVVYGWQAMSAWPPEPGMTATDVLAECARLIAGETARGREGHWTHDMNRLIALRQAEAALLAIITSED